jgi:hypothetical protein
MIPANESPTFERSYMDAVSEDDIEVQVCLKEIDRLEAENSVLKSRNVDLIDNMDILGVTYRKEIVAKDATIEWLEKFKARLVNYHNLKDVACDSAKSPVRVRLVDSRLARS